MGVGTARGMTEDRYYSEEEASRILRLANETSAMDNSVHRDEMLRAAIEAGIPASAIEEAERRLAQEGTQANDKAEFRRYLDHQLRSEVASRLGVCIMLVAINLLTGFHSFWSAWPVGILLAVLIKDFVEYRVGKPWEDTRRLEKWRAKRDRRKS